MRSMVENQSSSKSVIGAAGWYMVGSQWWQFNIYKCYLLFQVKANCFCCSLFIGRDKNVFDVAV